MKKLFLLIASFIVLLPFWLYGYIDPGTGSYFVQILIASVFGAVAVIKIFWGNIRSFFIRIFSKNKRNR